MKPVHCQAKNAAGFENARKVRRKCGRNAEEGEDPDEEDIWRKKRNPGGGRNLEREGIWRRKEFDRKRNPEGGRIPEGGRLIENGEKYR